MTTEASALVAIVDGVALSGDDARELWKKFSDYMGEHRGDFAGFAKASGYVQIAPEYRNGKAVLVAYTKEPPRPAPSKTGKAKPKSSKSRAAKPASTQSRKKPSKH